MRYLSVRSETHIYNFAHSLIRAISHVLSLGITSVFFFYVNTTGYLVAGG